MQPRSKRTGRAALMVTAAAVLLSVSGCAVWRIGQSAELARLSQPFQQSPDVVTMRLLIVGDSTGVGTGASAAQNSVAGLLGRSHPLLLVENRASDGARFADVVAQLAGDDRFDVVIVLAGGNDVIRLRGREALAEDIERVTALATRRAQTVVLMPSGNAGNAPFFFAPVSWLMTSRSRQLHRLVRGAATRHGAVYVNLFHERADDPFVSQPGLNASDGLHPSDAGYRVWFTELMAQADLTERLASARVT